MLREELGLYLKYLEDKYEMRLKSHREFMKEHRVWNSEKCKEEFIGITEEEYDCVDGMYDAELRTYFDVIRDIKHLILKDKRNEKQCR